MCCYHYSKKAWVEVLKNKSAKESDFAFKSILQNIHPKKIKIVHTDNGTEFMENSKSNKNCMKLSMLKDGHTIQSARVQLRHLIRQFNKKLIAIEMIAFPVE